MKWLRIGAIGVALAGLAWGSRTYAESKGPTVTVRPGDIHRVIAARGVVVPSNGTARVLANGDGKVERVEARAGDAVRAGALLAAIAPRAGGDEQKVTAPIDGTILARNVDPGDSVTPFTAATPLFEVADTTAIKLRIEVEERDAADVAPGQKVRFGGVESQIERVAPRVERRENPLDDVVSRAASQVRVAWATIPAGTSMLVGRHVDVTIDLASRHVDAAVPRDALAVRDGRAILRVKNGLFVRETPVRLGACDGELVEVEGVAPGTEAMVAR